MRWPEAVATSVSWLAIFGIAWACCHCGPAAEPEPGPPIVVTKEAQDGGPMPAGDYHRLLIEADGGEQ